jgi:signal transduction histidine kinase
VSGAGSTGLGLDIVRRVAEAAGGRIDIAKSPLGGARIAMLLPVPSDAVPVAPPSVSGKRRRGRTPS